MESLDSKSEDSDIILEPHEFSASAFTPEEKKAFESALTLGSRQETVEVLGHTVVIKTTSIREDLQIAEIIKPFDETQGKWKAFQTATVAASVVSIDDEPLHTPISVSDHDNIVRHKFNKLLDYYGVFISQVFEAVVNMTTEVEKSVVAKLGKSSG